MEFMVYGVVELFFDYDVGCYFFCFYEVCVIYLGVFELMVIFFVFV